MGIINYYRRFIINLAKVALPLNSLLRKNHKFVWGEHQEQAFQELKSILCAKPVLTSLDLSKPFIVTTDASDYALGAILSQGKIGQDRPCAYASRCLKGSELRYSTYDKELLAVVRRRSGLTI